MFRWKNCPVIIEQLLDGNVLMFDSRQLFRHKRQKELVHNNLLLLLEDAVLTAALKPAEEPLDLTNKRRNQTRKEGATTNLIHCNVCDKYFDRPSLLKRHLRTHTGEKPYICNVCSKGFSTSSSLNTHRRIHTGEKPHQCHVCDKRFTASSNLYYHRMTHTKNKPHKCKLCTKSFTTPGDLRVHLYAHSGSWPYICGVCCRGFAKHSSLCKHLQMHSC